MSNHLKHTAVVISMVLITNFVAAQAIGNSIENDKNNILKLNLPALVFKNFSVQYERKISKKNSFAVAVRYRPVGSIPFQSAVKDAIDDASIKVDQAKIGNFGITPEFRFYLGKKGALHGLYIGPFICYNHYNGDVPINYSDYVNNMSVEKTAVFSGSTSAFTAGFQLGAQWKLSDKIYLDWWILGPNYGFGNGDFNFAGSLTDIEEISLRYELEKIQQTIPLIKIEFPDGPPDNNKASFKVKGPWAGIRSFGINLGYRF